MKTLIIYSSVSGNTKKVAQAMVAEIKADIIDVKEAKSDLIEEYELVGFGSGVYLRKFSKLLSDF